MTITVGQRRNLLDGGPLTLDVIDALQIVCANGRANLLVYCVMGDHLHAVIQVIETDLISILRNFKSFSTRIWWKHGGAGSLWQRSAYDRGIRVEVYLDRVLAYVFENPASEDVIEEMMERGTLGGVCRI